MSRSISFDVVATTYDETRNYPAEVSALIARQLLALAQLGPNDPLLECGIGTGRISLPMLAEGADVVGIDISPRMMERLHAKLAEMRAAASGRAWGTLTTHVADMTEVPFEDGSFGAVVAVHVLHLISDWQRALHEIVRVLRPGGVFLLGQDQRDADDLQWRVQSEWLRIIGELSPETNTGYPGVGYTPLLKEFDRRNITHDEHLVARWQIERTPRQVMEWITLRQWSRTWDIPDDLFAISTRALEHWMRRRYGGQMDVPQAMSVSFTVARVHRPR